jgi:hypothetical protein
MLIHDQAFVLLLAYHAYHAYRYSTKIPFSAVHNNRSFHQAANSEHVLFS